MKNFVGREFEFSWLHDAWEGDAKRIFLTGPKGIGRRELAAQYLTTVRKITNVVMLQASENPTIALAQSLGIRIDASQWRQEAARLRRALSARDIETILVSVSTSAAATALSQEHLDSWSDADLRYTPRIIVCAPSDAVHHSALHCELRPLTSEQSLHLLTQLLSDNELNIAGNDFDEPVVLAGGNPQLLRAIAGAIRLGVHAKALAKALRAARPQEEANKLLEAVSQLLPRESQKQLRSLSFFPGRFDAAAAVAIVFEGAATGPGLLNAYASAGWLAPLPFDTAFAPVEVPSAEAFASERDETHRRYVTYFAGMARSENHARRASKSLWRERDNLECALTFAERLGEVESAAALLVCLSVLYSPRGMFVRFVDRALRLLQRPEGISPENEARVRLAVGEGLAAKGRNEDANRELRLALAYGRHQPNAELVARSCVSLAHVADRLGEIETADRWVREGLDFLEGHEDSFARALLLRFRATHHSRTNREALSRADYEAAADAFRRMGDNAELATVLLRMGIVAFEHRDIHRAAAMVEEALEVATRMTDERNIALCELLLAVIRLERGLFLEASTSAKRAESMFRMMGDPTSEASASGYLGNIAAEQRHFTLALECYDRAIQLLLSLGEVRLTSTWRAGRAYALFTLGKFDQAKREYAVLKEEFVHARADYALIPEIIGLLVEPNEQRIHEVLALGKSARFNDDVRFFLRLLQQRIAESITGPAEASTTLIFERSGKWFLDESGNRVSLSGNQAQRRVLATLLGERLARPGNSVSRERILEAGWPGERMTANAATNRIKVTLNRLRAQGLANAVETTDGGYRLGNGLRIRFADDDSPV
jgi:tetratricopeptide (TPR) repeat protein